MRHERLPKEHITCEGRISRATALKTATLAVEAAIIKMFAPPDFQGDDTWCKV